MYTLNVAVNYAETSVKYKSLYLIFLTNLPYFSHFVNFLLLFVLFVYRT